ncbi:MAG TPA: helix-turn-helix transcriptional regulator [Acidimicrobiales bacterium]|nr:helix-turn-helix transcriptional regulator [Acidimicrobiales bacterium]
MDAADRIVACTDAGELRRVTVETLSGLTASPLAAWNEVCPRTGQIEAVTFPAMSPVLYADLAESFALHVGEHPVIANHLATADPRPWAISDLVELGAFRQTGLYCEFYRPLGAKDQISFILPDTELIIGIALNSADATITDREHTLCSLLRPLLLQTYRHLAAPTPDMRADMDFLERRGLTSREVEVMILVRQSASTKQMASQLGISARTVEKHVEHALTKLGVASRLHAVALLNRRRTPTGALRYDRPTQTGRATTPRP